jgi:hypothetical protein
MARRRDDSSALAVGLGVLGVGVAGALLLWPRRAGAATHEQLAGGPSSGNALPPLLDIYVNDDAEALARVITSEAGSNIYSDVERRWIAWAVRNRAQKHKTTIARLVCQPCGPQGQKMSDGKARPFASSQRPTTASLAIAREVLAAPQSTDPTVGATAFFEPKLQDKLVAEGRPGYRFNAAQIRERWQNGGQRPVGTVGAFEFFT